jgi:hypothetical protein
MVANSILWFETFIDFKLGLLRYFMHKLLLLKQHTSNISFKFYKYSNPPFIVKTFAFVAVVGCADPAVE